MNQRSRRDFLRAASLAAAALAVPAALGGATTASACADIDYGLNRSCGLEGELSDSELAGFKPWWVQAYLPTKLWPTGRELDKPLGAVQVGQYFQVQAPQSGSRLRVFDPRGNQVAYIGAEAVGPVGAPVWADYLNGQDGRWIDVSLTVMQHAVAMQGDQPLRSALVCAGLQGTTKPGQYQILRRIYNETMDSRTVPGLTDHYLLKNVLYTQYFTGDGAAIHYNWWGPPYGFGRPGSHGCLGMMLDDSKFFWDWADIGVPVIIHA